MKIVFQIDGGIGKSIIATAVCNAIKKQYPKDELIVITGYPEVFTCNPYVDKIFHFNNLNYFYKDNIEGHKVMTLLHNPYQETDFITRNGHLIKVWCEMFGIKYNGEQPELFINNREKTLYSQSFGSQKPIMLLQTNGGAANQPNKYSWSRDLPIAIAQQIVNTFANEYNIVHIRREDQLPLQNTTPIQADFRAVATLITMSSKRLFIDSFCQHAAAALGMPSVVCWIANTPEQFGYDMHHNIIANEPTIKPDLRQSVFSKFNISGTPTEFPYNHEGEIFNVEDIIEALREEGGALRQAQDSLRQAQDALPQAQDDSALRQVQGDSKPGMTAEGKKKRESTRIRDRIVSQANNSMVARRLLTLIGKTDLTEVKQILDIGSWHLGQSIEFANIFKEAAIDAFEPVPDSYKLCKKRLAELDEQKKNRIRVHNTALSDSAGEIPFYAVEPGSSTRVDAGFSSMFKFNDVMSSNGDTATLQKEIAVTTMRLDSWCEENGVTDVDIMWMDAQGAELLVLQGADKILQHTKIIMTEVGLKPYYEGHTLKADIDAYLAERGFRELEGSFEVNIQDYEANVIYVR